MFRDSFCSNPRLVFVWTKVILPFAFYVIYTLPIFSAHCSISSSLHKLYKQKLSPPDIYIHVNTHTPPMLSCSKLQLCLHTLNLTLNQLHAWAAHIQYTVLLLRRLFSHCWLYGHINARAHTQTHDTVNTTLPLITPNEYTREESKGVCVSACLSKQCGGVRSDKASGRLLVQFPCDAGDKRATPVCIHTCINSHTYDISHSRA